MLEMKKNIYLLRVLFLLNILSFQHINSGLIGSRDFLLKIIKRHPYLFGIGGILCSASIAFGLWKYKKGQDEKNKLMLKTQSEKKNQIKGVVASIKNTAFVSVNDKNLILSPLSFDKNNDLEPIKKSLFNSLYNEYYSNLKDLRLHFSSNQRYDYNKEFSGKASVAQEIADIGNSIIWEALQESQNKANLISQRLEGDKQTVLNEAEKAKAKNYIYKGNKDQVQDNDEKHCFFSEKEVEIRIEREKTNKMI
jgi:hypothetical protein